jgi:hypothetical protein
VLLVFLQASLLTRLVASWHEYREIAPGLYGLGPQVLFALSIAAGGCLLRLVVTAVERAGIGNGFSLLIVGTAVPWLFSTAKFALRSFEGGSSAPTLFLLGLVGALIIGVAKLVQPLDVFDADFVSRPSAGILPYTTASGACAIIVSTGVFANSAIIGNGLYLTTCGALVALALVPAFAALFSSPSRSAVARSHAAGREVTASDRSRAQTASSQALRVSWTFHILLVGVWTMSARLSLVIDVTLVAVSTAVVRDLIGELRARRIHGDLDSVWPIHRFDHLSLALVALRDLGIDPFVRGAYHRVLGHFFFPFIPLEILVKRADADRAHAALATLMSRL